MSDWLERATAAARGIDVGDPGAVGRKTELEIGARARRWRRRQPLWWWGPLLALFVGSAAYAQGGMQSVSQWVAAQVGGHSERAVDDVEELLGVVPTIRPQLEAPRAAISVAALATAPSSSEPAASGGAASAFAVAPTPRPQRPAVGASTPTLERGASEQRDDGWEMALYRKAHRLHFDAGPREIALRAWDEYLAAAPNGVFALEARYNRGRVLLELGRHREARRSLLPFAAGQYGAYRRAEASRLLDDLERSEQASTVERTAQP